MPKFHYSRHFTSKRESITALQVALLLFTSSANELAAKSRADYHEIVDHWTIEGVFSKSTCSASVKTKEIGLLVVSVSYANADYRYSFKYGSRSAGVSQERAEEILTSKTLEKDGKIVATTGGSWEVLQEVNRCIEASAGGE